MLDAPIDIPFKEPWIDTPAVILHEFQRVAQSKRASSLCGAPISVTVSTIGRRDGGKRLKAEVLHNINQGHLLKIENSDAYCFFRSAEATRLHKLIGKPGGLTANQFSDMMAGKNQRKQTGNHALGRYAKMLMAQCGIPFGLPSYPVEQYAPIVQDFYEKTYPGMFRLSVFSSIGWYRPVFLGAPEKYICDLPIYYDEQRKHFHGIRTIHKFFSKSWYCIDCQRPYDNQHTHSYKCQPVLCDGCGKLFDNEACYDRHVGARCNRFKRCLQCGDYYDMQNIERFSESGKHECGYKFCLKCNVYHCKGRDCFISPLSKPEMKEARFCFFDIESIQDKRSPNTKRFRYLHECNAVHATIVCTRCIDKDAWREDDTGGCEICGPQREHLWSEPDGKEPLKEFIDFLLYGLNKKFPTYVLGHYSGKYDLHAVNNELYRMGGLCPSVIRSGHRIYQMILSKPGVIAQTIFKDSYCLVPTRLANFVSAFALHGIVDDKPYFPYLYNRRCNYDRRLPHLPAKQTYEPQHMKPGERVKFEKWYEDNYWTPFYLPDALREYVTNDVKILTHGMIKFRKEWLQLCGEDIIQNCITISSACMRNFRMNHLKKDTLVISPHGGYERNDRHSHAGLMFLKWMARTTGLAIRTSESAGGEYRHRYTDERGKERFLKLDGYVAPRNGGRPIAIEFQATMPLCLVPVHQLRGKLHDGKADYWRRPSDNPYKGLLKVVVVAPQSLLLPVLPIKMDQRLLFSTCRTCSKEYRKKSTYVAGYKCEHTEAQRQFVGCFTHDELNKALEKGYRVKRVNRVWEWPDTQWTSDLFKSYVRQWMKLKVESSELPTWVQTDANKEKFAKENLDLYGIQVKAEDCIPNPTRRQIAKDCLNSFWGRFAIRSNLSKTIITDKPHEFFDLVADPTKDVLSVDMLNETTAHVTYNTKDPMVEEVPTSNIFVAIWTTSQARLRLYSFMEQIASTPGCLLLYTDTDSVIFLCPRGKCPIQQGDVLGAMKSEYPKHEILEFICGGAKQYGLKLALKSDPSEITYSLKYRGITLDDSAAKEMQFDTLKAQVLNYPNARSIFVDTRRFELSKVGEIHTLMGMKRYRPVNQKTIIRPDDLACVPFGYNPHRP
ncbi:C25F9.2 protein [Aphelenchoides avenae]|nr:C25F9.2 protein [Aphelenchus avenae]